MINDWSLIRPRRCWCPEWLWWLAAHIDRRARWIAWWLTEDV